MPDFQSFSASDNVRFARSKTLYQLADGEYNLILLPKFAFVFGTWLVISQAYAGGANGAATIGYTGTADGFMAAATSLARATGTKYSSTAKWFNTASSFLTITLSDGSDTTLMIGHVIVAYTVLH